MGDVAVLPGQLEALPIQIWLQELERLSAWCSLASDEAYEMDERAIRRAYHLAVLAPDAIRRICAPQMCVSELEALLEDGALDQACRAVISIGAEIEINQNSPDTLWTASFRIAQETPVLAAAPTPIRAMICGWSKFYIGAVN